MSGLSVEDGLVETVGVEDDDDGVVSIWAETGTGCRRKPAAPSDNNREKSQNRSYLIAVTVEKKKSACGTIVLGT